MKETTNKNADNHSPNLVKFERLGIMIDVSRNAVMNLETVKKLIDIMSKMGYNTLMLYTEDTYEIEGHPYFGYGRGRYSKDELKLLDSYALEKGVELIPCIQTLAHLNCIMRWPQYSEICDVNDILMVGEERVYQLIESMFETVSECYTSRIINIGMDEAHMVGLGKYLNKHGFRNRIEILSEHLHRVAEIARRHGFTIYMASDMFFSLANFNYLEGGEIDSSVKEHIPDDVKLIYWDYFSTDKSHYDGMMKTHQKISEDVMFAGGLWTWTGFVPHNKFSIKTGIPAIESCIDHGISTVMLTLWGDDGGECSRFSVLPSMFYLSRLAQGIGDETEIKAQFYEMFQIPFDDFMLLDLPNTANDGERFENPDKYMLYNDCFLGLADATVLEGEGEEYARCAKKLSVLTENSDWGWLFKTMKALCDVLSVKIDLGIRTRRAYQEKNLAELEKIIADYERLSVYLYAFYNHFQEQWMIENKPQGFELHDFRIGGLIHRVKHCKSRLKSYLQRDIETIDELEENPLDLYGRGEVNHTGAICMNSWLQSYSAGISSV